MNRQGFLDRCHRIQLPVLEKVLQVQGNILLRGIEEFRHFEHTQEDTAEDRIARDKLIQKINARRSAIQNAADRLYPYWNDDHDPTRRLFKLPVDRPFVG